MLVIVKFGGYFLTKFESAYQVRRKSSPRCFRATLNEGLTGARAASRGVAGNSGRWRSGQAISLR